jgi:hypothetical protein
MALLYPFVYLQSQRRLDALSSALYYAGATWSVIPGSESFFGTAGIRLPSPAERLQCRRIAVSKSRSLEPWNFIVDGLANGRMVRILSVVEVPKRECPALGGGRGARAARHADSRPATSMRF